MAVQGLKDLIASERGIFCLVLLIAATVLVVLNKIPSSDWLTFVKWLAVTLVVSKTATGAMETWAGKSVGVNPSTLA